MSASLIKRYFLSKSSYDLGEKITKLKNRFARPKNDTSCLPKFDAAARYNNMSKQRHPSNMQRLTANAQSICLLIGKDYQEGRQSHGTPTYPAIPISSVVVGATLSAGEKTAEEDETANISDDEIKGTVDELRAQLNEPNTDWVKDWEGENVTIWSRQIPNKNYREYKVYGHYDDLPAVAFFYVQYDIENRRLWDTSTEVVMPLTRLNSNKTETIYWRVKLARFLSQRDYVYARRYQIDIDQNYLVYQNRAVEYKGKPAEAKYVRVTDYNTKMLVKPYHSYTENGFEFIMTYIDDTKVHVASAGIVQQIVRNHIPPFLNMVHRNSASLWRRYQKHDFSGRDAGKADGQVIGLRCMIKKAEVANLKKGKKNEEVNEEVETSEQEDEVQTEAADTKAESKIMTQLRRIPLKSIKPPKYLPDWRAYARMIIDERRFRPVPMMLVHPDKADRVAAKKKEAAEREAAKKGEASDISDPTTLCLGMVGKGDKSPQSPDSCPQCKRRLIDLECTRPFLYEQCPNSAEQSTGSGDSNVQDKHDTGVDNEHKLYQTNSKGTSVWWVN